MSAALLRSTPALRGAMRATAVKPVMGMASTQFVRGKATLPDLSCKPLPVVMNAWTDSSADLDAFAQTTTAHSSLTSPARSWSSITPSTTRPT